MIKKEILKLLNEMFYNYTLEFNITNIENDSFDFEIIGNEQQYHITYKKNKNDISINILTYSECYECLGYYKENCNNFNRSTSFFETLFFELLI